MNHVETDALFVQSLTKSDKMYNIDKSSMNLNEKLYSNVDDLCLGLKSNIYGVKHQINETYFNPRPGRGWWMPPPEVFLRCIPDYEADRAEILHSLWDILCATFGKKI